MTWDVYSLCRSQLIVGFSGVVGIRLEGIISAMDLLEIYDTSQRLSITRKILAGVDELYSSEGSSKEPETFGGAEEESV
jgi:hypothetical protein